ncbi:unnamed protein product [Heterobilharzia americana]|nr:unnamed protein product [Heterobilharzia americana]
MRSFSAPTAIPNSCLPQYQIQNNFSQQDQAILNSMAQPTFSLMPAVSYSSIPVCTSPTSTNAILGSNMMQPQQPVLFSAAPGSFFLAQSGPVGTPVVGAPSFVFAPGQTNQNAFVVAQPLSQASIAGHMTTHPNPANCVIRLPDGRFVLPATAPNNLNLQSSLTRICGPQSNYFPTTVSVPTSANSSAISSLTPHIAQPPGQNQQKLCVGTNPSQFTGLQALPSGMAIARLPNGTYATVSLSSTGISGSSPIFVNNPPIPSTLANPIDNSSVPRRNTPTSRSRQKLTGSPPTDTDVLRRLDDQITSLQRLPAPTEMQLNRLKQLIEVKHQLTKVSNMSANPPSALAPRSTPTSNTATNPAPLRNPNPGCVQITPTIRREVLDLLTQYNLIPRPTTTNNNEETFIVEFRLNQQRYQLRLTRAQKVDMERLLFSITSQRQAEVLTIFQQEQNRPLSSAPRARLPPSPVQGSNSAVTSPSLVGFSIASQPLRFPSGIQTFAAAPSLPMHTFHGASGLRLVTARQVVPPTAIPGPARPSVPPICSSTPVMGVVAALAVPSVGTCVNNPMFAPTMALNSAAVNIPTVSSSLSIPSTVMSNTNETSGLLTTIPVTSFGSSMNGGQNFVLSSSASLNCSGNTMLSPNNSGFSTQSISQPSPFTLSCESSSAVNSIRPVALNLQQAARIGRLRAYLTNDLKMAVEKPPVLRNNDASQLPSPLELLEALAPYHVLDDADNTKKALDKVDRILEESVNLLLQRKKETIEAVNSLIFKESLHKLEPFLEDRLLLANMALDLERDIFTIEKEIFAEASKCDETVASDICNTGSNVFESMNEECVLNKPTDDGRKRPNSKLTPILKHSTSLLPPPWCKLLGPLAYLHPLTFDANGRTTVAEIKLPSEEPKYVSPQENTTHIQSQSYVNSPNDVIITDSTSKSNTAIPPHCEHNSTTVTGDDDINGESSDEAEADRLLGLGISTNRPKIDKNSVNGLLEDGTSIEGIKNHSECDEFDEAYEFWQELMHERDISIGDMNSGLLENNFDNESNSMDEPPNKSLRLLDNGQSHNASAVQHSEDPDIDAAIRSILSTSD